MKSMPSYVLHIMGPMGAGKSSTALYISDKFNFQIVQMSEVVRDEATKNGLPITRENMNKTYENLRREFGNGIVAVRAIESLMPEGSRILFDGARHIDEVIEIQKFPNVLAIYIDSKDELLLDRLSKRARVMDKGDLNDLLQKDLEQVLPCKSVKGVIVVENNGNIGEFYKKIDQLIKEFLNN